jgi:hypothetical protein
VERVILAAAADDAQRTNRMRHLGVVLGHHRSLAR